MVQNRSFEDANYPIGWTFVGGGADGKISLDRAQPLNANNPTCLRLEVNHLGSGLVGIVNEGYKGAPLAGKQPTPEAFKELKARFDAAVKASTNGMWVEKGKSYGLSLYLRRKRGPTPDLVARLESSDGTILAEKPLRKPGVSWSKVEVSLTSSQSDTNAHLSILARSTGTVWIDMVSLFPQDTYKGRKNGLRPDLVAMLADMHPGVLRFPGGSFSEGAFLDAAWRWKETIGDVATRKGNWNIWGYRSSNGLGFYEYLQLAEDLGAAPLYVAHVGIAERGMVPMDEIEPWIQDTLDAIEYANGPVTSKWGQLRAKAGHPKPFNLKYVEIGNENGMAYPWGGGTRDDYLPRYSAFYDRIKAKYPQVVTIANIHTEPDAPADMVDEHYYDTADWFMGATHLFDHYDRSKPKLYVGEYADTKDAGQGNLRAAIAEAAFMTGLERNADVVAMSSYAPLFVNREWQRWSPNAIVFDNHRAFGTPSYQVQKLFSRNRPDVVVPLEISSPLVGVAGKNDHDWIVKVVNPTAAAVVSQLELLGATGEVEITELTGPSPESENSFESPFLVSPKSVRVPAASLHSSHKFPPYSVTVVRWKLR
jgi:alpha-L-arabinofuranosidase